MLRNATRKLEQRRPAPCQLFQTSLVGCLAFQWAGIRQLMFCHFYRRPVDRCCKDAAAGRLLLHKLPSPRDTRLARFPELTKTIAFLSPDLLDKFHEPQRLTHTIPIPTALFNIGSQQSLLPDDSGPERLSSTPAIPTELMALPLTRTSLCAHDAAAKLSLTLVLSKPGAINHPVSF